VAILLGDTLYSDNPAYYTQRQVDSIIASIPSWDSTYIYERHDSLLTAFTAYKAIVDPLLPPYFVSAEVGTLYSDTIVVTLSKTVVQDSIPDDEAFMFTEGSAEIDVTNVAITDNKIYLALASTPQKDSTLLLDYTKPSAPAAGLIQDADGYKTPSWINSVVTNNGIAGPLFVSAEIGTYNDSIITVKMSRDLLADSTAAVANFSVKEGVADMGVNAITISNDTLYVTLDSLAFYDSTYTISYTRGPKYLQDASGYLTVNWSNQSVANTIEPTAPATLTDTDITKLWVAYNVGITMDADSTVTAWADQSGSGNHLTSPGSTYDPKWTGSEVSVLLNDMLEKQSIAGIAQPLTLYVVIDPTDWQGDRTILRFGSIGPYFGHSAFENNLQAGNGIYKPFTENQYHIVVCHFSESTYSIKINDGTVGSGTGLAKTIDRIEMFYGTISKFKEIILRTADDDASVEGNIRDYLNAKYDIF